MSGMYARPSSQPMTAIDLSSGRSRASESAAKTYSGSESGKDLHAGGRTEQRTRRLGEDPRHLEGGLVGHGPPLVNEPVGKHFLHRDGSKVEAGTRVIVAPGVRLVPARGPGGETKHDE
eukprot:scaffold23463_cov59-Phaeocystis_antarctica.AAC.8